MPDREAPARAVYDHTEDEPRPTGRRRRQVADWGVGEELFDGMPGRRFDRRAEHRIPRGGADDGRRTIVIAEAETVEREIADEEFASREEALRAREEDDALWGGDEPFARVGHVDEAERGDQVVPGGDEPVAEDEPGEPAAPYARGPQGGRRTVKIGGRPGELRVERPRRPPKTVSERVGPRPDRVAAWAFALGLLLILIAVLS